MKRIFFFLLAAGCAVTSIAQTSESTPVPTHKHIIVPQPKYHADSIMAPWVVDVNLMIGVLTQDFTTKASTANYANGINLNTGNLKLTNGVSMGGDVQIGYFFGKKRHWGVGTGFMYLYQQGDAKLDNYHVEYQAKDIRGDVYRQIITANAPIKEQLQMTNLNIPLVLKYKTRFSHTLGFAADAGLLFNLQMRNTYKSNASFDYEAAYLRSADGSFVYDNTTPGFNVNDVLYTKAQLAQTITTGTVASALDFDRNTLGYNVGLNQKAATDHGTVSYTTGSVGFILRPTLSIYLSDNVALNLGFYYLYQNFSNTVKNGYMLTNKVGDYNSSINNVTSVASQSYGFNAGVRFLFGRKGPVICDEDAYAPTLCGLSDGMIALNGLHSDDSVVINYQMNGVAQTPIRTMTDSDGTATINNLGAGSYDSIMVTMRKRHASGAPATLVDPPLGITFESMLHPTAFDKCDGSITMNIPRPGKSLTISYSLNGAPKTFTGVVSSNGRIVMTDLCGGSYTNISATMGKCTAYAIDVTLVNPPAPPPPPPPAPVVPPITVSDPILFQLNKTVVRDESMPIIDLAVEKMKADKDAIIVVNGYTDITGKPAYNKALSLRRANAVKKELIAKGIPAKRIKVIGHGSKDPAESNDTPEGMAKNRRAVMHMNVGE